MLLAQQRLFIVKVTFYIIDATFFYPKLLTISELAQCSLAKLSCRWER